MWKNRRFPITDSDRFPTRPHDRQSDREGYDPGPRGGADFPTDFPTDSWPISQPMCDRFPDRLSDRFLTKLGVFSVPDRRCRPKRRPRSQPISDRALTDSRPVGDYISYNILWRSVIVMTHKSHNFNGTHIIIRKFKFCKNLGLGPEKN